MSEILEFEELNKNILNESIEKHNVLNPVLWTKNNELKLEIRDKIIQIVNKFTKYLFENNIDLNIVDIYILGSNANYNYTKDSDLDVHIIIDDSNDCSEKHLLDLYSAYKTLFNSKYDIKLKGINVEIYVEPKDNLSNISSSIYSIKDGWIKFPNPQKVKIVDEKTLNKYLTSWKRRFNQIKKNPSIEAIDAYINKIYEIRKYSLLADGEFGLGNLLFKEIRNNNYLTDLKALKIELENKELSLESLNENNDRNN